MERLKVALMGLTGVGEDYLSAIRSDDQFDLVAVADADPEILRRPMDIGSARVYEDYRSLIVETAHGGLDLLFVALEPFQSIEFVQMAAERGIGVFHKAPFARNTREAERLVHLFEQNRCPLVVSRQWQFEPAFSPLSGLIEPNNHIHAAIAEVRTVDGPIGWRGDRVRAGGGVLLNGAYEAVDILIHLLGLPVSVYARCSSVAAPGAARNYDTEDVSIVSLSFGAERIGSVTAWRGAAEPTWRVTFISSERTVEVCADALTVVPHTGGRPEHHTVQTANPVSPAISAFGASRLLEMEVGSPASTAREHLPTMAVIEAAYLAAKTGAPESPDRFLS
ncbi:MAG: Gfo/Idh/MocA family oxidoreductase [Phycisphaerae bacterium]